MPAAAPGTWSSDSGAELVQMQLNNNNQQRANCKARRSKSSGRYCVDEHDMLVRSTFPRDSLHKMTAETELQQSRGRSAERQSKSKKKRGSHSEGRASSMDFIRKVPVSPFCRNDNDQHTDTMERQRLNETIRATTKTPRGSTALQELFANSSHCQLHQNSANNSNLLDSSSNSSAISSANQSPFKIKRNSNEPVIDTKIPANYVKNLAKIFQQDACHITGRGATTTGNVCPNNNCSSNDNDGVTLLKVTGSEDTVVQCLSKDQRTEADNQISYIQVQTNPPMSVTSIDSDGQDLDVSSELADNTVVGIKDGPWPSGDYPGHRWKATWTCQQVDTDELTQRNLDSNNTAKCVANAITTNHARTLLETDGVTSSREGKHGKSTEPHHHHVVCVQQAVLSNPMYNGNFIVTEGSMPAKDAGGTSESNTSNGESTDCAGMIPKSGHARSRHTYNLHDNAQYGFHASEGKNNHNKASGNQSSSEESVYVQPLSERRRPKVDAASGFQGSSPIVSDMSTSGCSSGSENENLPQAVYARRQIDQWGQSPYPSSIDSGSLPSQNRANANLALRNEQVRGHVHTNGCYGHRSATNIPHDRRCYASPDEVISASMPTLPVSSSYRLASSDIDSSGGSNAEAEPKSHGTRDPKTIMRAAHLSNELVRINRVLDSLHPVELQRLLVHRLRQRDSKAIVALGVILPRSSFPVLDHVHCVRCHKNFDPRVNSACTLKHPSAYVMKIRQDSHSTSFYCKACDGQFALQGMQGYDDKVNSYMAGFCFNGLHTTNPNQVNYCGIVKTCEEHGCVECYV